MICKICGEEFTGHANAVCCSPECRLENKRLQSKMWGAKHYTPKGPKLSNCVVCGKEFQVKSGGTITCSPECRDIRRKQKESEQNAQIKVCVCAFCGKSFETVHRSKYCGKECRDKAKLQAALVDHPERHCKVCGKLFKPKNARGEYCSKQCQKKLYSQRQAKRWATQAGISLEYEHKPSHIDNIEKYARAKGLRYADLQKQETIQMFGRVELPEWVKGEWDGKGRT